MHFHFPLSFRLPLVLLLSLVSHIPLNTAQSSCPSSSSTGPPCLFSAEAANLALRWLQIFQTNSKGVGTGAAIIPSALAPNFTYYDEGASFGVPGPVYHNRSEVTSVVSGSGYSGALVTDVQYSVLDSFASCDVVVCRWQSNSRSANATNVTMPVGTAIEYKGTDYLVVDLSTRLIYNATSSSDLLNYYLQLGDDVIQAMM